MRLGLRGENREIALFAALTCVAGASVFLRDGNAFVASGALLVAAAVLIWGPSEDKKFLALAFMLAFLVRIALSYALHVASYPKYGGFISGDDKLYSMKALRIALIWQKLPYDNLSDLAGGKDFYGVNPFTYLLAAFYRFFGSGYFGSKLLNCLVGSVTPLVVYLLGKTVFSSKVAKGAMLIASFYPSIVLWSTHNLKDPLVILLIVAIFYLLLRPGKGLARFFDFSLAFLLAYLLKGLQRANVYSLIVAVACFALYKLLIVCRKWRLLPFAAIFLVCAGLLGYGIGKPALVKWLRYSIDKNTGLYTADNAGYRVYDDEIMRELDAGILRTTSLGRAYLKGVGFFLLSPFPWRVSSMNQLKAYPQVILWYALLCFTGAGLYRGLKSSFDRTLLLALFLFIGVSFWSMAEGNVGSAFRHRDYFAPIIFIYAARGALAFFGTDEKGMR